MERETASLLTDAQREWLTGEKEPARVNNMRSRVYSRIRATIQEDAELVAEALDDGTLDKEAAISPIDHRELYDGISALVAVAYLLGGANHKINLEKAIREGKKRGEEGRIEVLKQRLDEEPFSLEFSELLDLQQADPETARKVNRLLDQFDFEDQVEPPQIGSFDIDEEDTAE